jgi:membrane protein DedA with SNARE-associated domain
VPLASITSFVGDHGVYAVFVLMLAAAVVPAASELVMVYAGAVAGGWALGSNYDRLHHDFNYVSIAIGVLVVALIGYLIWRRRSSTLATRR